MKVLLDIEDDKAAFVMEVLSNFKYVKTEPITETNNLFLSELKEAVQELNLIKTGKLKGIPAEEFLNGL